MEPSRILETVQAPAEAKIKETKLLTFEQLLMIVANDNEIEQEYQGG
jgi:hypothetical protein